MLVKQIHLQHNYLQGKRYLTNRACQRLAKMPLNIQHALQIEKWDECKNGKLNRDNVSAKLRQDGYNVTFYSFYPGTVFPDHTHGVDKKDFILSGKFLFRMNGEEVVLQAGDMIQVPKGVVHYAEVVGSSIVQFGDGSKIQH
eukprot:TRINITY_DN29340_c0_g1_i1.p4 TRINITY_DN29340_c0_g1~~TRINITY_DN29340_c0_g1_i1.p4  ORF type:complete len:142 (-),score=8.39 TRINITY_DN29340_c0_g1_i1:375-800(-)